MTALPARRAPRRCDDGASARAFTRRPTTAGSTRRTYDGTGETALGASRGGAGRGTASAGGRTTGDGSPSNVATSAAVRRRRITRRPPLRIRAALTASHTGGAQLRIRAAFTASHTGGVHR